MYSDKEIYAHEELICRLDEKGLDIVVLTNEGMKEQYYLIMPRTNDVVAVKISYANLKVCWLEEFAQKVITMIPYISEVLDAGYFMSQEFPVDMQRTPYLKSELYPIMLCFGADFLKTGYGLKSSWQAAWEWLQLESVEELLDFVKEHQVISDSFHRLSITNNEGFLFHIYGSLYRKGGIGLKNALYSYMDSILGKLDMDISGMHFKIDYANHNMLLAKRFSADAVVYGDVQTLSILAGAPLHIFAFETEKTPDFWTYIEQAGISNSDIETCRKAGIPLYTLLEIDRTEETFDLPMNFNEE